MEALGLDPDFWRGRRVLLTGHTGFKGAWLAVWLERLGAEVTGFALPPEDGSLFDRIGGQIRLESHLADVRDAAALRRAVQAARPQVVLHMAAQALVRDSYRDPVGTLATNVVGTANLLEALRERPEGLQAILVVTSDKCYRNLDTGEAYRETDPLGGKDPYSASKACQEIVAHSFRQSFFAGSVPLATARAGNVIGGGDMCRDRLVPDIVRARTGGQRLVLRYPNATRPWQHVLDPLSGYLLYAERLAKAGPGGGLPEALNLAPPPASVVTVQQVVEAFDRVWGGADGGWDQAPDVNWAEAKALNLDAGLAHRTLGWRPRLDLAAAVGWTAAWYKAAAGGAEPKAETLAQMERYAELSPAI